MYRLFNLSHKESIEAYYWREIFLLCVTILSTITPGLSLCEEAVTIRGDSTEVRDIAIDQSGNIYVSKTLEGIFKYDGNDWISIHDDFALHLAVDSAGNLWASFREGDSLTFGRFSDGEWTYYDGYDYDIYPVYYIDSAREDVIWGLASAIGVQKFDFKADTITEYTVNDGLAHNMGRRISVSPDGHVWISHTDFDFCEHCVYKGISHFDGDSWETFNVEDGLPHREVGDIEAYSANEAYIGCREGLVRYDGEKLVYFDDCGVAAMTKAADGALWIAGWIDYDPVYIRYHNGRKQVFDRHTPDYPLTEIVVDHSNNVWTLTSSVVRKANGLIPTSVEEDSPPKQQEIVHVNSYPNPANPISYVEYFISDNTVIELSIYNIQGQLIENLWNGWQTSGSHTIRWNNANYASGIYFCKIRTHKQTKTTKILILQ